MNRRHDDGVPMSSDEDDVMFTESGDGILEFSADKAGQDVTPANYDFTERSSERHLLGSLTGA